MNIEKLKQERDRLLAEKECKDEMIKMEQEKIKLRREISDLKHPRRKRFFNKLADMGDGMIKAADKLTSQPKKPKKKSRKKKTKKQLKKELEMEVPADSITRWI